MPPKSTKTSIEKSNEITHVIDERDNIIDLDMMYRTLLFEEVNDATLLDKREDEIMVNENEEFHSNRTQVLQRIRLNKKRFWI